jgi:hypothetical protein
MKCLDCPLKYTGQTGRTFHTSYKEYLQSIRNNSSNLGYSSHMLNMGHAYGTIIDSMDIVRTHKKGKHLHTLDKYHIYKISKKTYT